MIDQDTLNNFPHFSFLNIDYIIDWWIDMNCMIGILIQIERIDKICVIQN